MRLTSKKDAGVIFGFLERICRIFGFKADTFDKVKGKELIHTLSQTITYALHGCGNEI